MRAFSIQSPGMQELLQSLATCTTLNEMEAEMAFEILLSGKATTAQISAFLMALRIRGETVAEITGAARAVRSLSSTIVVPSEAIDTCGTGGDARGTYNISTAAALIIAGCGVPVAKHGNRAVTSRSGSADVLEALGVKIDAEPMLMGEAIAKARICFLMNSRYNEAMRHVMTSRKEMGIRTIFNLLGPLSNPAGVRRQVVGVFSADWMQPMATVLGRLGAEWVWVVHSHDGLDEISTIGPTDIAEYRNGTVRTFTITPDSAGLVKARPEDLKGDGTPAGNAAAIRALLNGVPGPFRDVALLNAAAGLIVAGAARNLKEGIAQATAAVDGGRAHDALETLVTITNLRSERMAGQEDS